MIDKDKGLRKQRNALCEKRDVGLAVCFCIGPCQTGSGANRSVYGEVGFDINAHVPERRRQGAATRMTRYPDGLPVLFFSRHRKSMKYSENQI